MDIAIAQDARDFAAAIRALLDTYHFQNTGHHPSNCLRDTTVLKAFMTYAARDPATSTYPIRQYDGNHADGYLRRLRRLFPVFATRLRNLGRRRRNSVHMHYTAQSRLATVPPNTFNATIQQRDQADFFDDPGLYMLFYWILPIDVLPEFGIPIDYVGLDGGPQQLFWHRPRLTDRMDFGLLSYPEFAISRANAAGRVWIGPRH